MVSEVKVRLSKKNTLYIPKQIALAVGLKGGDYVKLKVEGMNCLLYTSPSPRDRQKSRMPSSA